jgi:hypothetical protein
MATIDKLLNSNRIKVVFLAFIWFAVTYYSISFLWGGGQKFRDAIPWYFLVSRDIVFISLLLFFLYEVKALIPKHLLSVNYKKFLKVFLILLLVYVGIILTHSFHKEMREIAQHDLRNIIFYSFFLPFLPAIFRNQKSLDILELNILYAGLLLSALGILTRYLTKPCFTWNGRVISTMGDPNNFAIFISLCMFILISKLNGKHYVRLTIFFLLYLFAFVMANSMSAFAVLNFGMLVLLILIKGKVKGILYSILIFYTLITASFMIKIVENPHDNIKYLVTHSFNEDKYLIDKLNIISEGKFSRIFLFGLDSQVDKERRNLLGFESFTGNNIRTYNNRMDQIKLASLKDLASGGIINILLGDFRASTYKRTDFQYLNLIFSSGVLGALIFFSIFSWSSVIGLKHWKTYKDTYTLPFAVFILSMILFGFNGAAFLNRFPINFLLYLSTGIIFLKKDIESKQYAL